LISSFSPFSFVLFFLRLINSHSIDQSRISAEGIGFLSPKTNNLTEISRKKNRRVEAVLILP
jgi:OOP family OmpA-OmpF porin